MEAARASFRKWLETDGHLELKQEQENRRPWGSRRVLCCCRAAGSAGWGWEGC